MRFLKFYADYKTLSHAGAEGMFQIITIEDESGKDITNVVGISLATHFTNADQVKRAIAKGLGVSVDEIELEEVEEV